jgi:outer membrane biosynthesis protein TonB
MMRATLLLLLAATLALAILMVAGCGQKEGTGQGSPHESDAEGRPTPKAEQGQKKKPERDKPEVANKLETGKAELANKPSQDQRQHKRGGPRPEPKSKPKPEPKSKPKPEPKNIPGLTPQDVYLSLENRGFTCSEPEVMGHENDVRWTCERQEAKGRYLVEINSKDANSVRLLKAWVISPREPPARADALAQDFLGYVARVPYEGAQPEEAKAWVEQSAGSKASAKFGGVSYTLAAKADRCFLKLEKLEG